MTYWIVVIRLEDSRNSVSINPDFGNNPSSFIVDGREFIWTPNAWNAPSLGGVPLLAPWANRLDAESYNANGSRYLINSSLANLRFDAHHQPIHGLLLFASGWKTVRQDSSSVTNRLEFWRFPKWMAQFPFAHAIEMTHRLNGSTLEIETAVENLCDEPLPLSLGYHPYFQLTDSPRETWKVHIAARDRVGLSDKLVPTSERTPVASNPFALQGVSLDAVFTNLTGEAFVIEGKSQRLTVRFGPKYPVAIIYSPVNSSF
ncbi:MAG: aldose 1-epimerase, partial [Acidobacteriia bacterium]|nr:aldose 1-epimerase [Terriglobia bacterium]